MTVGKIARRSVLAGVALAALVAGAAEAIEGEAASVALDKIDESLQKYQALLDKKGA